MQWNGNHDPTQLTVPTLVPGRICIAEYEGAVGALASPSISWWGRCRVSVELEVEEVTSGDLAEASLGRQIDPSPSVRHGSSAQCDRPCRPLPALISTARDDGQDE